MAKLYLLGIFALICAVFVSARNTYQNNDADIDAEIEAIVKTLEETAKRTEAENITEGDISEGNEDEDDGGVLDDGNEDEDDGGVLDDDEFDMLQHCQAYCDVDVDGDDDLCTMCQFTMLDGDNGEDTEEGTEDNERQLDDEIIGKGNLQERRGVQKKIFRRIRFPIRIPRRPIRIPRFPIRIPRFPIRIPRFPIRIPRFPIRIPRIPIRVRRFFGKK